MFRMNYGICSMYADYEVLPVYVDVANFVTLQLRNSFR